MRTIALCSVLLLLAGMATPDGAEVTLRKSRAAVAPGPSGVAVWCSSKALNEQAFTVEDSVCSWSSAGSAGPA